MKKLATMIFILCTMVGISVPCYAQSIDNKNLGISFILSDDWIKIRDGASVKFYHNTTEQEGIAIEAIDADWAWSLELADEAKLKEFCEEIFSDSNLAEELSSQNNNVYVTVKTESTISSYETYNNILYYRYEKAYTASAYGYYDTPFYETVYVTAKNGKLYFISYNRDTEYNHFAGVVNMLNTLSYENGEIKIKIDGERIFPDSAPMIIEGRTLVPIRAVAEKMGYSVAWDAENQLVILTGSKDSTILHFGIGSDVAVKNLSEEIKLDVPAIIVGGRTYLPLRAVAEAMDADVNWNGAERTVEIAE